jgi:hypothetical protein
MDISNALVRARDAKLVTRPIKSFVGGPAVFGCRSRRILNVAAWKAAFVLVLHSSAGYFTTSDTPRQHFSRRDFLCPQTRTARACTQSRPVLIHAHSLTYKKCLKTIHTRGDKRRELSLDLLLVSVCVFDRPAAHSFIFLSLTIIWKTLLLCAWRDEKRRCPRSQTHTQHPNRR